MSAQLFHDDILFFQRLLSSSGLYTGKLDGIYGSMTANAEAAFDKLFADNAAKYGTFDPRSEAIISTLMPKAQVAARKFMTVAKGAPFQVKLLSGTRSYAEQDALYNRIPKVTKARGGRSWHNYGIAFDFGVFVEGHYYTGANSKEDKAYLDMVTLAKANIPGLEFGADWISFRDLPHVQLAVGKTISQSRALLEIGQSYV